MARCFGRRPSNSSSTRGRPWVISSALATPAGVECTHGQLRTGFTDGLSRDNTNGFTHGNRLAVGQVGTVALFAHTVFGAAVQDGTDLDAFHAMAHNDVGVMVIHHLIFGNQHFTGFGITEILYQEAALQTFMQAFDGFATFADVEDFQSIGRNRSLLPG